MHLREMEVESIHVNLKALWEMKIKTKETETIR